MGKTATENRDFVHKSAINFAVSPEEKRAIKEQADRLHISVSSYIRLKVFGGI